MIQRNSLPKAIILAQFLRDTSVGLHGYELQKRTVMSSGNIYPYLRKMKEEGWLLTGIQESSTSYTPQRIVYYLNPDFIKDAYEYIRAIRESLR